MIETIIINRKDTPTVVKLIMVLILLLLNVWVSTIIVFREIWIQFSFVPVVIATLYWGKLGGLALSVLIGIFIGPEINIHTVPDELSMLMIWPSRIIGYVLITMLSDYFFRKYDDSRRLKEENLLKSRSTGLYNINKLLFDMKERKENGNYFLLIVINIDNFKELSKYYQFDDISVVNNKFIELVNCCFPEGNLYSVDNSEYVTLIDIYNEENIEIRIKEMIDTFSNSLYINGHLIKLQISVGVYDYNGDNSKSEDLINKARIACDRCKVEGFKMFTFDEVFKKDREHYLTISAGIKNAVDNEELYLLYQPIINLNTSEIVSAEILCRWNRGSREKIGPAEFIKVAEDVGAINYITKWIIKNASRQYLNWHEQGYDIRCAINFSSADLIDQEFIKWAKDFMDFLNIERSGFGIEITERVISGNNDELRDILSKLKDKGFKIEIDDFGTGYNSLSSICEIPFDIIKIDKYFIDQLQNKKIRTMTKYIIEAVQNLGKEVIAEGVEHKWQYDILNEYGCDMIQGYYFSKPLKANDFIDFYKRFDITEF